MESRLSYVNLSQINLIFNKSFFYLVLPNLVISMIELISVSFFAVLRLDIIAAYPLMVWLPVFVVCKAIIHSVICFRLSTENKIVTLIGFYIIYIIFLIFFAAFICLF